MLYPNLLKINWLTVLSSNAKLLFPTKCTETSSGGSLHLPMFSKVQIW